MDALPIFNAVMSTTAAIAALKLASDWGALKQHVKDIDSRLERVERRPIHAHVNE